MKDATKRIFAALALAAWGIVSQATCVTTIPATTPTADFTDNGDGTVLHKRTGLTWMRCAQGQTWSGGACSDSAATYTWQQALQAAKTLNDGAGFAGQHDWRLPNVKELASIVEGQCFGPAINATIFPRVPVSFFWSGSAGAFGLGLAWLVNFDYGNALDGSESGRFFVRLVRGGQSFDNLGVGAPETVKFISENLPDGSYQVGAATKNWTFTNGTTAISGLKAVPVAGKSDTGLGITASEVTVGDVAVNAGFTVTLPIAPEHAGAAVKASYWKLVDGSGADVSITNSKTGQFWLKLRTNTPPTFSPMQLSSAGAKVGDTVSIPLLVSDADGDTISYSAPSSGSITNGVWSGSFDTKGLKEITVTASDGSESVSTALQVLVRDAGGSSRTFNDVLPGSADGVCLASGALYNSAYYAEIEYLALHGIVIGTADTSGERPFSPCANVTQAEALKMLMLAAKERGKLVFDEPPQVLPNLVVEDYATSTFVNASWALPYVLKAEALGIIPDASAFDPQATVSRAWLARAVARIQALSVPTDAFADTATSYQFPDQTSFVDASDYDDARAAAFFGYVGRLTQAFSPNETVIRADAARVASRILRAPTADDVLLVGATQQAVNGVILPAVPQGGALAVNGLAKPQSPAILASGDVVTDEWIDSPYSYVDATVVRVGQGLVANGTQIVVKDLAGSPVAIDTTTPDLSHDEIRTLLVILHDQRSGVLSVLRKDYGVIFPDRDHDGVRDSLDLWPDDPRYALDANGNGIPDNADAAFGIGGRQAAEAVTVGGTQTTIVQALLDGSFAGLNDALNPPPGAPTGVVGAPGKGTATLSFSVPTDTGGSAVTGYTATCGSFTASGTSSPITVAGLANGTTYSCYVTATNGNGTGPASGSISVTPRTVPGAPAIGTATPGNAQAAVSFSAPASNGGSAVTSYTANCAGFSASGTSSPITVAGLSNGTTYSCSVTATNAAGTGPASASVSVTPIFVHTVSASGGAHGSITPASRSVPDGQTASFSVTPDSGYTAAVSGCGGTLNGNSYTTAPVTANCNVSATFTAIPGATGHHTASGTYTWNPATGLLILNWTASDFVCEGPDMTTETLAATTVTATNLSWQGSHMVWARPSGVADDVVGAWSNTDGETGNAWELTFGADGSLTATGEIVQCSNDSDGGPNPAAYPQHWANGFNIQFHYVDATGTASAVTVSGPGLSGAVPLTYNSGDGSWNNWTYPSQVLQLGTPYPSGLPYTYSFSITDASGTWSANAVVACFQTQFVSNVAPTGSVAGTPVFSWTGVADAGTVYGVELHGSSGNTIWSNYNIADTSIAYAGPALTDGATYRYNVQARDGACQGSQSFVQGSFTYAGNGGGGSSPSVPGAPIIGSATAGNGQATVSFAAPASNGGSTITGYTATCGGFSASGAASPIVVNGLANGTSYACSVTATNATGTGAASSPVSVVPVAVAPLASFSPVNISFAIQTVDSTSAARTVTLSNTGTGTLSIASVATSGDFSQSNNCGSSLAAGASCTVSVNFAPTAIGNRTGSLLVTDNAAGSPQTVNLTGIGQAAGSSGLNTATLVAGWNLLGNGVEAPITVATTFNDAAKVVTIWKWVTSGSSVGIAYPAWAFYTPALGDGGQSYAASKGYDFLTIINAGEGFWVNAKAAFSVPLPSGATVASQSFMPAIASPATAGGAHALPHGWSLIATGDGPTPNQFDAAIATASATPPAVGKAYANLTTLWAWDTTHAGWYFWAPSLVNSGGLAGYLANKGYLDFTTLPTPVTGTLSPTTGFWVNMP